MQVWPGRVWGVLSDSSAFSEVRGKVTAENMARPAGRVGERTADVSLSVGERG